MLDQTQIYLFVVAALALLLVPGPAVLYIVGRSVNQGRLAGLVSVWGIVTAGMVHVLAAALGLSAILVSSALAFALVKYLGAAYLIYLGIKTLWTGDPGDGGEIQQGASLWRIYSQGVVVNLLNPKTALFFFAFLPQFIAVDKGNPTWQILTLGAIFLVLSTTTDSLYALVAGTLALRWRKNSQFRVGQRYFTGLVYIGLGGLTAFSGAQNQ